MLRRPAHLDFAWTTALLLATAATSAGASDEAALPLPRLPSRAPVYLAPPVRSTPPESLRQLPAPSASKRLSPAAGVRTAQAGDDPLVPRGGLVPPARKSVIADSAETDRRVQRLRRQLDELNEMLSRPPVEPPVIERMIPPFASESAPAEAIPTPEPEAPSPPPVEPPHTPAPMPTVHQPPHQPEPRPPEPSAPKSMLSATGLIKGLPVAAIDRVHVADNLFAAGEYVLASEIYEQVDRKAISDDESGWVEFQMANCSRRLGRIDDAKKRYRRVVSDPTLGWLQDMAKWRLDAIDERELLVKEHARLDAAIKQYSEVSHAAAKP